MKAKETIGLLLASVMVLSLAASIPVIAMTANAFSEDIHACLEAGMNAHVPKPIDMVGFEQTIRKVLGLESEEKQ